MYYVIYSNNRGEHFWDKVDVKDDESMRDYVKCLCEEYGISAEEDVVVFNADDEIR